MALLPCSLMVDERMREKGWNTSLQPYPKSLMAEWAVTAAQSVVTPASVMPL
jgi:hypothetical protein